MPLTVTMKIFSGRPNPVWILPDSAANEFHDRVARIRNTARISNLKPAGALGGLGYRGFKVQAIGDPHLHLHPRRHRRPRSPQRHLPHRRPRTRKVALRH
jgi:hypothetical protein